MKKKKYIPSQAFAILFHFPPEILHYKTNIKKVKKIRGKGLRCFLVMKVLILSILRELLEAIIISFIIINLLLLFSINN